MILTGATGCDNVDWGGAEWRLTPPISVADTASVDSAAVDAPPPRVYGPLLLAGIRQDARATLAVVGEVAPEGLLAVQNTPEETQRVAELTAPGSEWTLFAEGVRVGTLTVDERTTSAAYCPPRAVVSGVVELVPSASAAERLLALPTGVGEERPVERSEPIEDVYDQRVASLTWAGEAIPRNEATWPAGGLVEAREDIQVFQPVGAPGPAVAATFMYRDRLTVTPAPQGAYALFLLGSQRGGEYREDFAWYRLVDEGGKGAPRYFDHLDWNGDGVAEILLEVLGAERSWFAALGRRNGQWERTFLDVCGQAPAAGG